MSSKGYAVILSQEGLKKHKGAQTYADKWGVNQFNDTKRTVETFINELKLELVHIINTQKQLYQQITPERFRKICDAQSFGQNVVTLEDIYKEIEELSQYETIRQKNSDTKKNQRDFNKKLEEARKQELAAQKGIAEALAHGKMGINEDNLPELIVKLRQLSKKLTLSEANINQIITDTLDNLDVEVSAPHYEKLKQLVDTYRKTPAFKITNGKIQMTGMEDEKIGRDLSNELEEIIKKIRKQEKITTSSTKKAKKDAIKKIRQYYTRHKQGEKTDNTKRNKANDDLQELIEKLTDIVETRFSSKKREEVRSIVRTKIVSLLEGNILADKIKDFQGNYTFDIGENIGIYGSVSEELQATAELQIPGLRGEIIKIVPKVLGDLDSRKIHKVKGIVTANYQTSYMLPTYNADTNLADAFEYKDVMSQDVQDKGDVVYQLKNLFKKQPNSNNNNVYIAFSDKFRNAFSLYNQAIIGNDEGMSSLLNSYDLFQNTKSGHAILFALLNWHSVSYLSDNYKSMETDIIKAINMQILDFALNRKNLLKNIASEYNEDLKTISDTNTFYVFRIGANGFIPIYQILEGILIQMQNFNNIEEIVTTTLTQSNLGTSLDLYNQALSLYNNNTRGENAARWKYVADQVSSSIQLRTAMHFQQLLQIFTPSY